MTPDTGNRNRAELRKGLLDSAMNLLETEGVEGFSLKQAAENVGVSKQMIYTLFGSKADLIKAVYDRTVHEVVEQLKVLDGDDPLERLGQYAVAYREYVLNHQALFDMLYSLSLTKEFEHREGKVITRNEIFDYFDEELREAVEQGFISEEVDVDRLTDSLWATANGCIRLEIVDYYDSDEEAEYHYLKTLSELLWGGAADASLEDFYDQ